MTPMPEFGYDPIPLILSGEKVHTLRKQRCHGQKEICVKGKRTGIVLEFHEHLHMHRYEVNWNALLPSANSQWCFLSHEFALADGFSSTRDKDGTYLPEDNLEKFLKRFYGEVPETMWCCYFQVVQQPEEDLQ